MAIRDHMDWINNNRSVGYVDFRKNDTTEDKANQVIVFMMVGINKKFKIPVGYFLIRTLNAQQKKNLLSICIDKIVETGVKLVGIDGAPSNLTM